MVFRVRSQEKAGSMRRIMITAIAGTLALTACSETPTEVTDEDIANIEQTLMHGSELSWELTRLETRIGRMCMEDKGFDVHDDNALHGSVTPGRFTGFNAPYARIPTVEQAEQFAFGEWIRWGDSPDAESMSNDPDYLAFTADDDGWWDPAWDESRKEWDKADEEYQRAWEEAFIGAERMAYEEEASKLLEEAMENGEDIGEIDIASRPPFGGCELETIEAV
jgi:hypothetical protein